MSNVIMVWFYRATNFSQEPLLWAEMRAMSEALQSDCRDEKSVYLRGYLFILYNCCSCALSQHCTVKCNIFIYPQNVKCLHVWCISILAYLIVRIDYYIYRAVWCTAFQPAVFYLVTSCQLSHWCVESMSSFPTRGWPLSRPVVWSRGQLTVSCVALTM